MSVHFYTILIFQSSWENGIILVNYNFINLQESNFRILIENYFLFSLSGSEPGTRNIKT